MIEHCISNLSDLKNLLQKLQKEEYIKSLCIFEGSSIGQHFRHVVAFYSCIIELKEEKINYDKRPRNFQLETDLAFCSEQIENLIMKIRELQNKDFSLKICTTLGEFTSSFQRELFYALEHSIHHQALIKIGLIELGKSDLVAAEFGVAPSTLKFREQCVR